MCETWLNELKLIYLNYTDILIFILLEITKKSGGVSIYINSSFLQIKLSFNFLVTFTLIKLP